MFGGQAWRDSLKHLQEHLECRIVQVCLVLQQGLEVALKSILDACRTHQRRQVGED
ncbi:unnamed protein product, partial [Sphacelaria rigidula]